MKSITVTNTVRYSGTKAQGTHMLSYCAWTGIKIAVSTLYAQFPAISKNFLPSEHPALAVPVSVWEKQWSRLTEQGTEQEHHLAIVSVLKQLGVLTLGDEPLTPNNQGKLRDTMVMIGQDILPNQRFITAKVLPTARTNSSLSLFDFVTSVSCALLRKARPIDKLQWEEDLNASVARIMKEVTGERLKPARLAQWATEMMKAYTPATQAQRELVVECIVRPYTKIAMSEYQWAIDYLRVNLPISVTDVTSASVGRSIQSSTIIQYLTEKLAMLAPEVDMFSLIDIADLDTSETESEHGACERTKPAATAKPSKVIVINAAAAVEFDAVAYAAFPVLQASGLPYPSEMHRKIAFNKHQRALAQQAASNNTAE